MKPLKLELQAFGPFVDKQTVDFEKLAEKGMFLIKGSTGSGKTTIFDALLFALYGESTGEVYLNGSSGGSRHRKIGRNNFEDWRCTQAPSDMTTFVSFSFESNGHRYLFKRSLVPKRVNMLPVYEAGEIDEDGNVVPFFSNPKQNDLNAKAEELTGLTQDQFRQVVFLPQGQFERFLIAPSDEKENILKRIFGTERWSEYADRFFINAKTRVDDLKKEKDAIDNSLKDHGASDLEDLNAMISGLNEQREDLEEAHKAFQGDRKQECLNRDIKLAERFRPLHELEERHEELAAGKADIDAAKTAYGRAENAEAIRSLITEYEKAVHNFDQRNEELMDSENALPNALESVRKAQTAKAVHDNGSPVESLQKRIGEYEAKKPVYDKFVVLERAFRNLETAKNAAETDAARSEEKKTAAETYAEKAAEAFRNADIEARVYRDRYLEGIYGEIAESLADGTACPVCGSMTHPAPASKIPGSISKEAVDRKEEDRESARKIWDSAESDRKTAVSDWEGKRSLLDEKRRLYASAKGELAAAAETLIDGIGDADALEKQIEDCRTAIKKHQNRAAILTEELDSAKEQLAALEQKVIQNRDEQNDAKKSLDSVSKELETVLHEKGYDDVSAVKNDLKSEAARKRIHKDIVEYETLLEENESALASKRKELENVAEPDPAAFAERQREITDELNAYNQKHSVIISRIKELTEKRDQLRIRIKKYSSEIGEAESDLAFARTLRGDTGIGIQRYVLAVMFGQVIGCANEMLTNVHGGRYRLCRTDERGSRNKRGLELKVYDSRSPDKDGRNVGMLSGGEKFLVSLALSIGLSTVAQKTGVRIEALFIDEGFGTLDDDSVADAMTVLESVRRSSGMIGIISHIQLIESVIPTHVEVVKTDKGSHISMK